MRGCILIYNILIILLFTLAQESSAQCISGNCQNGTGTFRYGANKKYTGQFSNGLKNGKGVLYENGNFYDGNFYRDRKSGEGTMQYSNGERYQGSWKNDVPNGLGTMYFKSGIQYRGNFLNGEFSGHGKITYAGGDFYTGSWLNNEKNGPGRLYRMDGKVIVGTWQNGELTEFTENDPLGETEFSALEIPPPPKLIIQNPKPDRNTKPDLSRLRNCGSVYCATGEGYYTYPDGSLWVGAFKNGYPSGNGVCYYSDHNRYEGSWTNNAPNGEGVMTFADGKVRGAVWINGSPVKELEAQESIPAQIVHKVNTKDVRIWAVVVGVGAYTAMNPLRYSDDDANLFFSFLRSPEGGALPENQVELLVDEWATRENILNTMREYFLRADENDVVLLYFSGHGLDGCFLPVDYDGFNNKLRHEELKNIFMESKAKHKLCIADACHSGSLNYSDDLVAKGPMPISLQRYYQAFEDARGGMALLMSSRANELSMEDKGLKHGIFTYYVMRGLKGNADDDNDDLVTISELYRFVYNKVRLYTANTQSPILTGTYDEAMPVSIRIR